ncbi:MAG: EAL domain-containing protein [Marinobacter sp.]|uniref:bifunctional diguanylate cyclase/phosphodiesterase n=1 Tax=Marinobacter sp. TaxID=50741 RepID=UPI0034A0A463
MQSSRRDHQLGVMTLRGVLLTFTSGLILTLLVASMSVSFDRFRDYISSQLDWHAQDAATAVGLSLSNAIDGRDPIASASLIDAMFDSGSYLQIRYTSNDGELIAGRSASLEALSVPDWFVTLADLPAPAGEAAVMQGWQRLGSVSVISHPGPGYRDLWRISGGILLGSLIVGGAALASLFWLITRLLRPLRALEAQAEAIGRRDFRRRVSLSSTREMNRVTHAMNQMADDLGPLFEGQAKLIQHLRHTNSEDSLTGLANRRAFDQRLKVEVESEEKSAVGVLALLQFSKFAEVNQRFGREQGDQLLREIAERLKKVALAHSGAFAGRRMGAEFAIFLPGVGLRDGLQWVKALITEFDGVYADVSRPVETAVHSGVAEVDGSLSASELLAACDEALRRAQLKSGSNCFSADATAPAHYGGETWRGLLTRALEDQKIALWQQPLLATDGTTEMQQQVFSRVMIERVWLKGALFVPMAERFGLMAQLDILVLEKALAWLQQAPEQVLSQTLGHSSVADDEFQKNYLSRIKESPFRQRLWVGIPEHSVHHHRVKVGLLVRNLRKLGVAVVVDRFGVGGVPFNYLRNLPFQALRIDNSFIHDIHLHEDNRFYLESMVAIAHSRGVKVFVSGVETAQEWAFLQTLEIDGAAGYYLGRPAPALL